MGALSNSDRTDLRAGHHQPPMPPADAAAPTHLSLHPLWNGRIHCGSQTDELSALAE